MKFRELCEIVLTKLELKTDAGLCNLVLFCGIISLANIYSVGVVKEIDFYKISCSEYKDVLQLSFGQLEPLFKD